MQIVQSHLTQTRVKNVTLCELHSTPSVKALQWRSSGTTSSVNMTVDYYAYANIRNNL